MSDATKGSVSAYEASNLTVARLQKFLSTCAPDDEVILLPNTNSIGVVRRADLHYTPEAIEARRHRDEKVQ